LPELQATKKNKVRAKANAQKTAQRRDSRSGFNCFLPEPASK